VAFRLKTWTAVKPDDVFYVASDTKAFPFVGVLVLFLAGDGKVSPDVPAWNPSRSAM
jgi:CubicO group peptidase (beta-lactamase class C family)